MVEDRIRNNAKLMERFPREGDFEVVTPKTVRCAICKKDIHLASEGMRVLKIEMNRPRNFLPTFCGGC